MNLLLGSGEERRGIQNGSNSSTSLATAAPIKRDIVHAENVVDFGKGTTAPGGTVWFRDEAPDARVGPLGYTLPTESATLHISGGMERPYDCLDSPTLSNRQCQEHEDKEKAQLSYIPLNSVSDEGGSADEKEKLEARGIDAVLDTNEGNKKKKKKKKKGTWKKFEQEWTEKKDKDPLDQLRDLMRSQPLYDGLYDGKNGVIDGKHHGRRTIAAALKASKEEKLKPEEDVEPMPHGWDCTTSEWKFRLDCKDWEDKYPTAWKIANSHGP
ncbi:hypothetical protein EJ06DRAFT_547453 [Trichodelitschia bisporula]|uniref:Uncharacterized protein n=1 Tax=Trichodelitschia bisporula TaxID=703511 RepID=A0A6G1I4G0_9PEZI|nr:hypothetical protein EJ06DRAFT_547453 [Trichodelitschia bisporula]